MAVASTPYADSNLIARNRAESKGGGGSVASLLRAAQARSGRSPLSMVAEHWRLQRKPGRLSLQEYFTYNLYDNDRYDAAAKERFLSERLHWPIADLCSDVTWRATTEDKWLSYKLLAQFGIATPETVAVVDRSQRAFGGDRRISDAGALRAFLAGARFPLFAKPNLSLGSFGAFVIEGYEDGRLRLDGGGHVTVEAVLDEMIGDTCYLLQTMLRNHAAIRSYAGAVATVRTMNLVLADRVATPFTLMKIPVGANIADNFWRAGNLLASLDPDTGTILRVLRGKGPAMQELQQHPVTRHQLVGTTLPHWQALRRVNEACARLFAPVRYQSLDIALTDAGPVVVEINSGGSFLLPQLASGQGFLTEEVRCFFESCGWRPRQR